MIRTYISIGVRRLATAAALGFSHALEGQQRRTGWSALAAKHFEQGRRQVRTFLRRSLLLPAPGWG